MRNLVFEIASILVITTAWGKNVYDFLLNNGSTIGSATLTILGIILLFYKIRNSMLDARRKRLELQKDFAKKRKR